MHADADARIDTNRHSGSAASDRGAAHPPARSERQTLLSMPHRLRFTPSPCGAGLHMRRLALLTAALAGLALPLPSLHAQTIDDDSDDTPPAWQEKPVQLPPFPREANLLPFDAGTTSTYRFAIDPASISVGEDGVVRYTLVGKSAQGAVNISYEGIRCASREVKLYAFGNGNGGWAASRHPHWKTISTLDRNSQHFTLAEDYFCVDRLVDGSASDIVNRLHAGGRAGPRP
ncbi:MAG: CNP1-like family protein [Burkholderiaceae bacterium]